MRVLMDILTISNKDQVVELKVTQQAIIAKVAQNILKKKV